MRTPYFLISERKLNKNIQDFQKALTAIWPNSQLAYSVKTNSLPWVLKYIKGQKTYAEVVSDEEYQLAKLCGFSDDEIVFNGPIKSDEYLVRAAKHGAIINVDSQNDLIVLTQLSSTDLQNVGIRVNLSSSLFSKKDVGYQDDGFRFGFSEENGELERVITLMRNELGYPNIGLHLHCNSITRSLSVYKTICCYAKKIVEKYDLTPSFVDVGGGFFGGVENKPTAEQYISVIKEELSDVLDINSTKLIIEPGSALIGSTVDYYTSVVDVKDTSKARIVTTDGSRLHIDPLWSKSKYMCTLKTQSNKTLAKQIICGYTCMDHDRIMALSNDKELRCGDQIVYHRVGAYSMTFGGMFIRFFPPVYVEEEMGTYLARDRISVSDYYRIHSLNAEF